MNSDTAVLGDAVESDPREKGLAKGSAPSVSVVVPTRNRPDLLARCVRAIVGQEYPGSVEVLVVFDQSDPEPVDVELPVGRTVRIVRNTRTPGLAGARNSGAVLATGELLAFCDDDDEWLPGKLLAQVRMLQAHPEAVAVAGGMEVHFAGHVTHRPAPARPVEYADLLRARLPEVNPCSLMLRRDRVLSHVGLVDEQIPGGYAEDYDFLLRIARAGDIQSVPQPLVRIYWHTASFFAERWRTIIDALEYLLAKYPDYRDEPVGLARIEGQIAFAHAALGEERPAVRWAARAIGHHWRQPRAYLALLVTARLVRSQMVVRLVQARGRGV